MTLIMNWRDSAVWNDGLFCAVTFTLCSVLIKDCSITRLTLRRSANEWNVPRSAASRVSTLLSLASQWCSAPWNRSTLWVESVFGMWQGQLFRVESEFGRSVVSWELSISTVLLPSWLVLANWGSWRWMELIALPWNGKQYLYRCYSNLLKPRWQTAADEASWSWRCSVWQRWFYWLQYGTLLPVQLIKAADAAAFIMHPQTTRDID